MKFKNNSIANKFRLKGNEYYKSLQFDEALICYNKSLCYALPTSIEFALCFANRSAVYFEIQEYEVCIENINLALDFGYKNKVHVLLDRLERCEELLLSDSSNKSQEEFFKLSYPANTKIPYIVDCIEIKNSKRYGRHLVTTRSLKAGDVIAIEKPFYKFLMNSARFSHCANCLKCEKLNLFPCCECNYSEYSSSFFH
jgi:tetratricopeptide (TPR) repeat protein